MSQDDDACPDLRALAREQTRTVVAALVELTGEDIPPTVRLAAIRELLDRGWGRVALADEGAREPGVQIVQWTDGLPKQTDALPAENAP